MAQEVKLLILAQIMISQLVGSSPMSGLSAVSEEPAWDPVSLSLSLPLPALMHTCPVSLSKINKH